MQDKDGNITAITQIPKDVWVSKIFPIMDNASLVNTSEACKFLATNSKTQRDIRQQLFQEFKEEKAHPLFFHLALSVTYHVLKKHHHIETGVAKSIQNAIQAILNASTLENLNTLEEIAKDQKQMDILAKEVLQKVFYTPFEKTTILDRITHKPDDRVLKTKGDSIKINSTSYNNMPDRRETMVRRMDSLLKPRNLSKD